MVLLLLFYVLSLISKYTKLLFVLPFISCFFLQDNKDACHVKTYEVALKEKDFVEGPWSQNNLDNKANLLIPVLSSLYGVIIGEVTIVYCSANAFKTIRIRLVGHLPSYC